MIRHGLFPLPFVPVCLRACVLYAALVHADAHHRCVMRAQRGWPRTSVFSECRLHSCARAGGGASTHVNCNMLLPGVQFADHALARADTAMFCRK
jgi:hypothetical protein